MLLLQTGTFPATSLYHTDTKKHIQSPSIIHSIQQSYLNTSSNRTFLSVCLPDLAAGKQEAKQTGRVCLTAHAWTIIRCGRLSKRINTRVCMYIYIYANKHAHIHTIIQPWIDKPHFLSDELKFNIRSVA